jgi:hypothetical protein
MVAILVLHGRLDGKAEDSLLIHLGIKELNLILFIAIGKVV